MFIFAFTHRQLSSRGFEFNVCWKVLSTGQIFTRTFAICDDFDTAYNGFCFVSETCANRGFNFTRFSYPGSDAALWPTTMHSSYKLDNDLLILTIDDSSNSIIVELWISPNSLPHVRKFLDSESGADDDLPRKSSPSMSD